MKAFYELLGFAKGLFCNSTIGGGEIMKKINLKEIKNKKKLLIISGVIVVLFLLLLINWDRMHYTKVLNDFYSGNHYLEIKARVPEEIRDRYYKERYETTEEEYKEKVKYRLIPFIW